MPLHRKLGRDLRREIASALTIAVVVALGIGCLVGFRGAWRDMVGSRDAYYREYAFADLRVMLRRAPRSALELVRTTPGIERFEGRIYEPVPLLLPGVPRRLAARLVSLPDLGTPLVNVPRLVEGRYPEPGDRPEVLLDDRFARARGLSPGSRLDLLLDGVQRSVTVAGLAMSPEFIYMLPLGGGAIPEPRNNAVVWARVSWVEEVLDMHGAFDDLVATVARGVDPEGVVRTLERVLASHAVVRADTREQDPSHRILRDELQNILHFSRVLPVLFLVGAALVMNLVLSRLVTTQRVVIGTLKALGVPRLHVLLHYAGFGLAIGVAGGLGGIWLGRHVAGFLGGSFARFFHFPIRPPAFQADLAILGLTVSTLAALLATSRTCLEVLALEPAEAMRPAPPELAPHPAMPRFTGLPLLWRLALRCLARQPYRALVATLGVGLGLALLIGSRFFTQAMMALADFQFRVVERQDVDLVLSQGVGFEAAHEAARLPGVEAAELGVGAFVELRGPRNRRRALLTGLPPGAQLMRPRAKDGISLPLPATGLVLSRSMAKALGVAPGDPVEVATLDGRGTVEIAPVEAVFASYLGIEAYAPLAWVARLHREPRTATVLRLRVPGGEAAVEAATRERPGVLQTTRRRDRIEGFRRSMQATMDVVAVVLVFLAGALALALNGNAALVAMAERRRELALYRMLGFRRRELAAMVLHEHVLVAVGGMMVGLPLGYLITLRSHAVYDTELYRLPWVFSSGMVARGLLFSLLFSVLAHLLVRRWLEGHRWQDDLAVKE